MVAPTRLLALILVAMAWPAAAAEYAIDPMGSRIVVHVGKSGLFGFAGHTHEVVGKVHAGRVQADPLDVSASSVSVELRARDFQVVAEKEKAGDAPKVQATMERDVLEVERHPDITFMSSAVKGRELSPGRYGLELTGTLSLHGMSRRLTLPVEVQIEGPTLTATGRLSITHDAFGLRRVSGGAGTVRVANDLTIDFTLVARTAAAP
jgi:polyisoprenoid-binding protein YceI